VGKTTVTRCIVRGREGYQCRITGGGREKAAKSSITGKDSDTEGSGMLGNSSSYWLGAVVPTKDFKNVGMTGSFRRGKRMDYEGG